jgi:hypothetical protein
MSTSLNPSQFHNEWFKNFENLNSALEHAKKGDLIYYDVSKDGIKEKGMFRKFIAKIENFFGLITNLHQLAKAQEIYFNENFKKRFSDKFQGSEVTKTAEAIDGLRNSLTKLKNPNISTDEPKGLVSNLELATKHNIALEVQLFNTLPDNKKQLVFQRLNLGTQLALVNLDQNNEQYVAEDKRNLLRQIKEVAPNFSISDLLSIQKYVADNKEDLVKNMKLKKKSTTYIRPSKVSGLPRSIQINKDGQVFIHLNKVKNGDKVVGKGGSKKVKFAFDLKNNQLIVVARMDLNKAMPELYEETKKDGYNEALFLNIFKGIKGFAQLTQLADVEGKDNKNKLLFFQPLYEVRDLSNLDTTKISMDEKKSLAYQMLQSCSLLIDKGVIHCDIKPQNFFLSKNKDDKHEVYLADFGNSKIKTDIKDEKILSSGTPKYMPPEYKSEYGYVDTSMVNEKIDAWALGVTLFEMFQGQLPQWANNRPYALGLSQESVDVECKKLDPELRGLISCLLQVDPNQRLTAKQALDIHSSSLQPKSLKGDA